MQLYRVRLCSLSGGPSHLVCIAKNFITPWPLFGVLIAPSLRKDSLWSNVSILELELSHFMF